MSSETPPSWDLIVVGSGPAGSSAARLAAAEGLKVLLLEKDATPGQSNVCAGGIPPSLAKDLSLSDEYVEKEVFGGIHYFPWGRRELRSRRPVHVCVNRQRFDALLASMAEEAGAELRTGSRAVDVSQDSVGVTVTIKRDGHPESERARVTIFADGVNTLARKRVGIGFRRDRTATAVSFASEFEIGERASALDMLELFYDPSISPFGYGWVFPKRMRINIGLGVLLRNMDRPFSAYRDAFMQQPRIKELVEGAKEVWHGSALIPARPADVIHLGRVLVAGDAAGFVHALWGAGNQHAVLSGRLAAQAVVESLSRGDDLVSGKRYEEFWARSQSSSELGRAWKVCRVLQRLVGVDSYAFAKTVHAFLFGKVATAASPRILSYPYLGS